MLRRFWLIAAIIMTAAPAGCGPSQPSSTTASSAQPQTLDEPAARLPKENPAAADPSIVLGKGWVDNAPEPENVIVYDRAALNIDATQTVVIPDSAIVEQGARAGRIELYMAKEQFGAGTSEDSIRKLRISMGCVRRTEKGKLVIGTTGEWGMMESCADMRRLLIRVADHPAGRTA